MNAEGIINNLSESRTKLGENIDQTIQYVDQLLAENEILREVLKQYADSNNWSDHFIWAGNHGWGSKLAKETLTKVKAL